MFFYYHWLYIKQVFQQHWLSVAVWFSNDFKHFVASLLIYMLIACIWKWGWGQWLTQRYVKRIWRRSIRTRFDEKFCKLHYMLSKHQQFTSILMLFHKQNSPQILLYLLIRLRGSYFERMICIGV